MSHPFRNEVYAPNWRVAYAARDVMGASVDATVDNAMYASVHFALQDTLEPRIRVQICVVLGSTPIDKTYYALVNEILSAL